MMNMGVLDRVIRGIIAIVLLLLAILVLHDAWQIVCWVIGGILAVTAVVGFCPLYVLLHISTKNKS